MGLKSKKITLNNLLFNDIKIGQVFSFEVFVDKAMVHSFVKLTGDRNPLHSNGVYAKKTEFGQPIVHGMLLSSFFSTLVGMLCPGKNALYLSQDLRFKNPLKFGSKIVVLGTVSAKYSASKIMDIETIIKNKKGVSIVEGMARVKVRSEL